MKAWKLLLTLFLPIFAFNAGNALALETNGTAIYSELGSQLYYGTLFVETPSKQANEILGSNSHRRMEIRFAGSMSKRRWSQTWTQSIAINSPRDAMVNAADDLSETLSAFQGGLEYGDTVIIDSDPLYGTSVAVNGVTLVKEKSVGLFNLFLSAWIGPVPPSSQFKNAILGSADSKNDYTAFLALNPSSDRINLVKGWDTKLKAAEEQALADAKAEEEAMKKAEEEANKKAEEEALAEQQKQALIEEEKRKAQEAARQAALEAEAARKEAERQAAVNTQQTSGAADNAEEEEDDLSVDAILAQQQYTSTVIAKIYKFVKYPAVAVKRNQEGSVRANIVIDRGGNLQSVTIVEEAQFNSLNEAVINAIKGAVPLPALPPEVKGNTLDMVVPVAFKLN